MSTAHTPGPWEILRSEVANEEYGGGASIYGDGELVAFLCWDFDSSRWMPKNEANAHLITAAPDLLASLETIVNGLRGGWWGEGSGEMEEGELLQAEAAIAKAKQQDAAGGTA